MIKIILFIIIGIILFWILAVIFTYIIMSKIMNNMDEDTDIDFVDQTNQKDTKNES